MYGVTVDGLMRANGLTDSLIYAGQTLSVPAAGGGEAPAGDAAGGNGAVYTVQPGDTLFFIGQKYGVPYQEIMAVNHLTDGNIYPGMQLKVPAGNGGSAAPAPSGAEAAYQVSRGGYFARPSMNDVDLLARLITAEADNQPYEAKVAVGAVVLNRVRSGEYPATIPEVIYQNDGRTYQFEPVMNGWINRPASPEGIRAAREALAGADPTGGARYFFCDWVTNKWLKSKPLARKIGDLVFTY
ncbi:MAG: cell wall hydrolase [Firmicutes bacterium]|nr:cell wall hydrolase [Bacillota bacterium]